MALKAAKMFKDFLIDVTETGVKLSANGGVTVYAKNDNFANQITIKSDASINFFAYKYITFDNSAIFSIDDVIENNKYYTLFISFVGNVKFDVYDEDIYVDGVSVQTLQRLGVDISTLFSIMGLNATFSLELKNQLYDDENVIWRAPFIKMRFSECPQNLSVGLDANISTSKIVKDPNRPTGRELLDSGRIAKFDDFFNDELTEDFFSTIDSAFTVYIPIPCKSSSRFYLYDVTDDVISSYDNPLVLTVDNFIERINALISDLTLSIEIVILSQKDIIAFDGKGGTIPAFNFKSGEFVVQYTYIDSSGTPGGSINGGALRDISNPKDDTIYPILCMSSWKLSYNAHLCGMAEVFSPQKYALKNYDDNNATFGADEIFLQLKILGSVIDLSTCPNDYVVITRDVTGMTVWTDWAHRIFYKIENTLQYTRDAYSNYEAYKKANIELVQEQERASLMQKQEQARELNAVQNAFGGISGGLGVASQALSGNLIGAAIGGIQSILGGAQKNIEFNMQQENERANLQLAQEQARETAQYTIVPASDIVGSVQLAATGARYPDAYIPAAQGKSINALSISTKITLNDNTRRLIEQYIFTNTITEKVIDIAQIKKPAWQTLHNFFQVKIKNKNPLSTRKAITIYVERSNNN